MQEKQTTIASIIAAFAIGGLIGASIALLMAPMSGEDTRKMIADKSGEIRDNALDTVKDTRDRASKTLNNVADQTKKRAAALGIQSKR